VGSLENEADERGADRLTSDEVDLSELDCKIFVDGMPGVGELVGLLAEQISGETASDSVSAPGVEMIVLTNDEAGEEPKTDPRRGFLFYDHFVEVYFASCAGHDRRVATVCHVLERLRAAVAACDYEDELS
jgi:hypothetical protein